MATEDFKPEKSQADYENEARAQGWRPQEEWTGEPERWVNAETFVTRAQNWSGHLKKELDEMRSLMRQQAALNKRNQEALIQNAKIREQELQQQIQRLEQQRADAISSADGAQAVALERSIRESAQELTEVQKQVSQPAINSQDAQVAADWRAARPWYGTDKDITRECDYIGNTFGQMNPNEPLSEILDFVDKEIKRRHPELAGAVTKPKGPQGGSDSASGIRNVNSSSNSDTASWESLDDTQKRLADQLIARGVFADRKAYVAAAAVSQDTPISAIYKRKKDVK